jgi:hypothetical protein
MHNGGRGMWFVHVAIGQHAERERQASRSPVLRVVEVKEFRNSLACRLARASLSQRDAYSTRLLMWFPDLRWLEDGR